MKKKQIIILAIIILFFAAYLADREEKKEAATEKTTSESSTEITSVKYTPESTTQSSTEDSTEDSTDDSSEGSTVDSAEYDTEVVEDVPSGLILSDIPPYSTEPYVEVNNNIPYFTSEEKSVTDSFEKYSELDSFGRCGVAYANLCRELILRKIFLDLKKI